MAELPNQQPQQPAPSSEATQQKAPQVQNAPQKPMPQVQRISPFTQMLNDAIAASKDPEVPKIKEEIDSIKKQRGEVIGRIKDTRRRLNYKESESVSIAKLLAIEKAKAETEQKRNKIGYLKKLKNRLEFRISTEATSLSAEKELIRKIEEVNKELNEAYRTVRLERKSEFVKKDVEQYKAQLVELEAKIVESDKKLDELYDRLRKLLGIKKERQEFKPAKKQQPEHHQQLQEINLEDIAIIKKKKKADVTADESA